MLLFNHLQTYLFLALVLFAIGLYGVLARRNLIAVLISVELILNAASINFMAFNRFLAPQPAVGQIITLFIMAVAAAEAAIALSIIIAVYRRIKTVNIDQATELRG
ncbi:MAG: NADH-quinone oxidoreductase subunit NuoK [Desulfobaccales bacterium]